MSVELNFIVALPSEARPLIDRYRLQRADAGVGIALYRGDGVQLAVSGVGKAASAYAVGVLAGRAAKPVTRLWLNVGIAGHRDVPPATIGIAHRIDDIAGARTHYPGIVFPVPCPSFRVACFDQPTTTYDGDALCDMESAGFYGAAVRCASVEFAHVVKIVSDNNAEHLAAINRETISDLVAGHLDTIEAIADQLRSAAAHLPAPAASAPLPDERWRFSATQSLQLAELERRWHLLQPACAWPPVAIDDCRSARAVIARLTAALDALPLTLPDR